MRDPIAAAVSRAIGMQVHDSARPVGGGSIHAAFRYRTSGGSVFVKTCGLAAAPMLHAEAAGLRELANANAVRVPKVLALGQVTERAFLCLEWLELGTASSAAHRRLGEQLASLHALTADEHGWNQDNFIGATPQLNARSASWIEFFRRQRLEPQLDRAERNGADRYAIDRGRELCERLDAFFAGYRPRPSLLHGDLWGGNWGALVSGEPVIFDPAVYYGDREADLAMTRLFGGFSVGFYEAYEGTWRLEAGAAQRIALYNLYHVINHFNLFGGGYLSQAQAMIDSLLAATRG